MQSKFAKVPERPDFPAEEEAVLEYWNEIDAFKKQLEISEGRKPYTFYDGPPFATGLPHYGHIAAGTIKDVMTRYATQTGHYCSRRFGWDCHGLPIEYEIDKTHKINSSAEREAIGVEAYNKLCREIVMTYSKEWEQIVGRFGRWIDFQNDYKTMDVKYMESVWWTFKQIFDKGLVYKGSKIMPYSTKCNTVLSNFEAGSNYQDTKDPAIYITFPLVDDPEVSLIAWTTTPWTLPSNLAAAVNPNFVYLKIFDEKRGKKFIVAQSRMADVAKQCGMGDKFKILEELKGTDLVGKKYTPLFDYFKHLGEDGGLCFTVIAGNFVTEGAGTGIVHCAPGFGDDDYKVCVENKLIKPGKAVMPIDDDGCFNSMIPDYQGVYFKDADKDITKVLKDRERLVQSGTVVHSYPYCWRSDTPLMYRAVDTWFIQVTEIKERLLKNNEDPKWVPSFVQEKRFKNWLSDACDWCFSRSRYWGNPIPIWVSEDGEEIVCVGSIKELQELTGCGEITDLHREHIDHLTIPSKMGKGQLKRIDDVFDCWFESGSMPYAQSHYPFSINDEEFMKGFPANFIAEGLDQTRGWFYTLMVISTAVKDTAPFKNLIVNGIVLDSTGKKLSKRLRNYPEPTLLLKKYGADAVRLYLCNSPVVRAEALKFKEAGVLDVVRDIFLPWFNAYRFLIQNISRYEQDTGSNFIYDDKLKFKLGDQDNFMDRWVISATQNMLKLARNELDNYHLYNVVKPLLTFLEQLTNWYVRLNRSRMKGDEGVKEQQVSLNILFDALLSTNLLMASITPFITEHMYQNMRNGIAVDNLDLNQESIHFLQIPDVALDLIHEDVELRFKRMQSAIENGRLIRERKTISLKMPVREIVIVDQDTNALKDYMEVQNYIKEELNCVNVKTETAEDKFVTYKCEADNRLIGGALKKDFNKDFKKKLSALTSEELKNYMNGTKEIKINGVTIEKDWLKVEKTFIDKYNKSKDWGCASSELSSVMLNTVIDDELRQVGTSREITNRIQKLRKAEGVQIDDEIEVYFELNNQDETLKAVLNNHGEKIQKAIRKPFLPANMKPGSQQLIGETSFEYIPEGAPEGTKPEVVTLYVCTAAPHVNNEAVTALGVDPVAVQALLSNFDQAGLASALNQSKGEMGVVIDGKAVVLKEGQHFWRNGKSRSE